MLGIAAGWCESVTRDCGMGSAEPGAAGPGSQPRSSHSIEGPGRMRSRCHVSLLLRPGLGGKWLELGAQLGAEC